MVPEGVSFWSIPGRFHFPMCESCPEREPEFLRLVDHVWAERLPAHVRAGISKLPPHLLVFLQTAEHFSSNPGLKPAYYYHDHKRFYFLSEAIFGFPEEEWADLTIAHEFTHAYLFAIQSPAHAKLKPATVAEFSKLTKERDDEVYRELEQWGFDTGIHMLLYEWGVKNGLWPDLRVASTP